MLATVSSADAWALSLSLSSFFFPAGAALDAAPADVPVAGAAGAALVSADGLLSLSLSLLLSSFLAACLAGACACLTGAGAGDLSMALGALSALLAAWRWSISRDRACWNWLLLSGDCTVTPLFICCAFAFSATVGS